MRKGYCLAVLILLMVGSMELAASASPMDRWPGSRYSNAYTSGFGNEDRQDAGRAAQTQNQVTLTLYVLDGGMNGELLSGVGVTVYDGAGNNIGGTTNSKGAVVLSGQPGDWLFTLAKDGYQTSNLKYTITKSHVAATYLQRIAQSTSSQSASSQTPAETATYQQEAQQSTQTASPTQLAQPQPVSLTIYVYETNLNGTALSGVQVAGKDSVGNSFSGITDSDGAVVLSGQPGTWQFSFVKEGYETLNLNYDVTETEEVAAYLQKTAQPIAQGTTQSMTQGIVQSAPVQTAPESQEPVDFTVYVHEGSLNGTALSGVQVTGRDAAGNSFAGTTDSDGAVVLSGQPGTWQFSFAKEGYATLNLNYNVTQTDYGDVYLQSAESQSQSEIPVVSELSPSQTYQQSSLQPVIQAISG
ncbi:MAG: collagen binding domain-containing protein [Methanotrichaceae archaeon]